RLVLRPAGLCLTSRSSPMAPPSNVASTRRVIVGKRKPPSGPSSCMKECMTAGFYTLNVPGRMHSLRHSLTSLVDAIDGGRSLSLAVDDDQWTQIRAMRLGRSRDGI